MFTKLSHVGIVVKDIEQAVRLWTETYGLKVPHIGDVPVEGIKNAFLPIGDNLIELMEPYDQQDMDNAVARRLARRGEGIYQIALLVDNMEETRRTLAAKGVVLIDRPTTSANQPTRLVVHPNSANGVLLEVIEHRGEAEWLLGPTQGSP